MVRAIRMRVRVRLERVWVMTRVGAGGSENKGAGPLIKATSSTGTIITITIATTLHYRTQERPMERPRSSGG